jgi:hypothetical protein
MEYEYLMNVASVLYIICYIPELYANYKNKNANVWNIPEKVVILIATIFAFAYAFLNYNEALLINYGPILGLDFIALMMRVYYAWKNRLVVRSHMKMVDDVAPIVVNIMS